MSVIKNSNWSSFMPDLIITILSVSIPLIIQYRITIKPLREMNETLRNQLNDFHNSLITEYINTSKKEQDMLLIKLDELQADLSLINGQLEAGNYTNPEQYSRFIAEKNYLEKESQKVINNIRERQEAVLMFLSKFK